MVKFWTCWRPGWLIIWYMVLHSRGCPIFKLVHKSSLLYPTCCWYGCAGAETKQQRALQVLPRTASFLRCEDFTILVFESKGAWKKVEVPPLWLTLENKLHIDEVFDWKRFLELFALCSSGRDGLLCLKMLGVISPIISNRLFSELDRSWRFFGRVRSKIRLTHRGSDRSTRDPIDLHEIRLTHQRSDRPTSVEPI